MTDRMSKEKRSQTMAKIKSKNTSPEILLRKLLWNQGKRFRIHDKTINGIPDISNKTRKILIFVDGCFWHGCEQCYISPKTNTEYWKRKFHRNKKRRKEILSVLTKQNWKIFQVWEHELKENPNKVMKKVIKDW